MARLIGPRATRQDPGRGLLGRGDAFEAQRAGHVSLVSKDLSAGLGQDGRRSPGAQLRRAFGAEAFINPSLTLLEDGRLVVAARLHRRLWPQHSLPCDLRREVRFSQFSGGTLMEESTNAFSIVHKRCI